MKISNLSASLLVVVWFIAAKEAPAKESPVQVRPSNISTLLQWSVCYSHTYRYFNNLLSLMMTREPGSSEL